MTGERDDITLYTDDVGPWQEAKADVERDLGCDVSKPQAMRAIIQSSEYGPDEYDPESG